MIKSLLALGAITALTMGGLKIAYSAPLYHNSGQITVEIFEARKKSRRAKIIKRYRK